MGDYFEFVDNLARNGEDNLFLNSGPIHAAIVLSRIFEYSNSEIMMFSGGFSGEVSNDPLYLTSLENFLSKSDTKLRIVVEDYNKNKSSKIYSLLAKYKDKVTLKETKTRVRLSKLDEDKNQFWQEIHFTVGDNRMLRVETNPLNFKAQVNFNSKQAQGYVSLFNSIEKLNEKTRDIVLS